MISLISGLWNSTLCGETVSLLHFMAFLAPALFIVFEYKDTSLCVITNRKVSLTQRLPHSFRSLLKDERLGFVSQIWILPPG